MSETRLMAVDPIGCGCTDCLTGYSLPVDQLNGRQAIKLHCGKLDDRTSGFVTNIHMTLVDGKVASRDATLLTVVIVGGYPGNPDTEREWDVTDQAREGDLCCSCVGDCDC